ncbi:hypothetical protein [Pseudonocardia endophytica]|uniref:Uncharacterized protein n=1 Tax=Pseudonocardia endophytica TaxID=401976 RepID=A0A4R1HQM8_PSEEN|nr:hypothetical protein [Pseudonocardia endophytica]TCK23035.1 hypothetical protein EV378_7046 [Pseudonocardia endophytica]
MPGRHRFAGEDRTIRPLLAAVVPVVAVVGMTVAAFMGGVSPATSTARIEVPRFGIGPDGAPTSAPGVTTAALPSALPEATPMIMNVSASGSSAVQRIKDERAEAARRAEQQRQARAAAAEAARQREVADAAQRARAAQEARDRASVAPPATPVPTTAPAPAPKPSPSRTPAPSTTPSTPRGLLDSLLGGRNN